MGLIYWYTTGLLSGRAIHHDMHKTKTGRISNDNEVNNLRDSPGMKEK